MVAAGSVDPQTVRACLNDCVVDEIETTCESMKSIDRSRFDSTESQFSCHLPAQHPTPPSTLARPFLAIERGRGREASSSHPPPSSRVLRSQPCVASLPPTARSRFPSLLLPLPGPIHRPNPKPPPNCGPVLDRLVGVGWWLVCRLRHSHPDTCCPPPPLAAAAHRLSERRTGTGVAVRCV